MPRHEQLEHQKTTLKKGQREEESTFRKTKEENEDVKCQVERRQDCQQCIKVDTHKSFGDLKVKGPEIAKDSEKTKQQ